MNLKEKILNSVESKVEDYMAIVQSLYDHPEIGNQEFESMKLLSQYLRKAGFDVEEEYILPTGFIGKYESSKPGPKIAFMCEYDALPEIGHGCGHNLIAAIGVAAGEALKSVIDEVGGTVLVVGTPAEENFGGKVTMSEKGVFDDVDAALMIHPSTKNGLGGKSLAIYPVKFEFFGKSAHGCRPHEGHSALDAAVMTYSSISMLRQFVLPGTFIHGIIKDGGGAANVIPEYASMEYYFRAPTMKYVMEIVDKAKHCAQGACEATFTTMKTSVYETPYDDTLINYTLADLLEEKYQEVGVENIEKVDEIPSGSTDVGAVSYKCPTIQGNIKIADKDVAGHSKEMAAATISPQGRQGLIKATQALALCGLELIENKELLQKAKDEFNQSK